MSGREATIARGPVKRRGRAVRWMSLFAVAGSALLAARCATLPPGPVACDGIQVLSDELSSREADAYCRYAQDERRKVDAFWGPTWPGPIRIHVSSAYRISRALVPAHLGNRGFVEMPLRRVRDGSGALLHEIVHVYAPNRNRFLAEGLAVHLHAALAGNPALPNLGESLSGLAARRAGAVPSLAVLDAVQTPRPLGAGADYERVFGAPLAGLEREWRARLSR